MRLGLHRRHKGFTLIEVLVATFILVIIVLILSKIFHQSSVSWSAGFRRAKGNVTGRAMVGFMARELMCAVADEEILTQSAIGSGSTLKFISLSGDNNTGKRVAKRIQYQLSGNSIIRKEQEGGNTYGSWGSEVECTMVTNVESIAFLTSDNGNHTDDLPDWLRIVLTVKRSDDVSGVGAKSFGPDRIANTADDIK